MRVVIHSRHPYARKAHFIAGEQKPHAPQSFPCKHAANKKDSSNPNTNAHILRVSTAGGFFFAVLLCSTHGKLFRFAERKCKIEFLLLINFAIATVTTRWDTQEQQTAKRAVELYRNRDAKRRSSQCVRFGGHRIKDNWKKCARFNECTRADRVFFWLQFGPPM